MSNTHAALSLSPLPPPLPAEQIQPSHITVLFSNLFSGLVKDLEPPKLPRYFVTTLGARYYQHAETKKMLMMHLRQTKTHMNLILDIARKRSSEDAHNVLTLFMAWTTRYEAALKLVVQPEAMKFFHAQLEKEAAAKASTMGTHGKTLDRGDFVEVVQDWPRDQWPFDTCKIAESRAMVKVISHDTQAKKVRGEIVVPVMWTRDIGGINDKDIIQFHDLISRSEDKVTVVLDEETRQARLQEVMGLFDATDRSVATAHMLGKGEKITIVNMAEAPWFNGVTGVIDCYVYERARFSIIIMEKVLLGNNWSVMVEPACVQKFVPACKETENTGKKRTTLQESSDASFLRLVNQLLVKRNVDPINFPELRASKYGKTSEGDMGV